MMVWGLAAALSLLVLASLLYPLLRGLSRNGQREQDDLAVYRDQLAELEHSQAEGLISADDAEAARAEIGRRMLALDRERQAHGPRSNSALWPTRIAASLVVGAFAGAFVLYAQFGAPTGKAMPFAERDVPKTREAIVAARGGGAAQAAQATEGGQSLASAEQRLSERMAETPDDIEGWLLLGRTRMQQRNYEGAREAFAKAHDLRPDNPRIAAAYGEALVMTRDGTVTPKALELFRSAAPANGQAAPQVQYYLALADFQQGDPRAALDRWKDMVANSPAGAPWLDPVKQYMAAAEEQLGREPGTAFADVAPEPAPDEGGAQDGPTQDQMAAAENMDPQARQEMIEGMVSRLAARLEENPNDLEGWMRLARSYQVLGQPKEAREALAQARRLAPENVDVLAQYARAIREAAGQQQTPESLAVSQEILDIAPDHPEALWFVAVHEARQGNTDAARKLFDRAFAALPDTPQTEELKRRADQIVGDG